MSNADWYARRVAPIVQQQQPQAPQQLGPPQGFYLPQPGPAVMPPGNYPPQQPQGYPQPPQGYPMAPQGYPQQGVYPPQMQNFSKQAIQTPEALRQAVFSGAWQGTAAARQGTHHCPQCGGPHFMERNGGGGVQAGVRSLNGGAAPQCYDCGFTGRIPTQGDQATWAGAQGA